MAFGLAGIAVPTGRAQTYVANLDGSSAASTFNVGVNTALGTFGNGWSVLTGSDVQVFNGTNDVVVNYGASGYGS